MAKPFLSPSRLAQKYQALGFTLGITCKGNMTALRMALAAALSGEAVPERILLRIEGEFPGFGDYYFEQLVATAAFYGVDFQMAYARSEGVRVAKQWLLDNCQTPYLWISDDDVLPDSWCLSEFSEQLPKVADECVTNSREWGFLAGAKFDVNNRRRYPDFSDRPHYLKEGDMLGEMALQNLAYYPEDQAARFHLTKIFDAGCVVLNVLALRRCRLKFTVSGPCAPSSGVDTLMALRCAKANLAGFFLPFAHAIHLEKPVSNFESGADRKEMLLRICDIEGLDHSIVDKGLYGGIPVA